MSITSQVTSYVNQFLQVVKSFIQWWNILIIWLQTSKYRISEL